MEQSTQDENVQESFTGGLGFEYELKGSVVINSAEQQRMNGPSKAGQHNLSSPLYFFPHSNLKAIPCL